MPDATPNDITSGAPPLDARTRILDAAERIVQAKGVPALTLEAAAREAGVSKGGLLYHFASKEALLMGLLTRLADSISLDFQAVLDAQPPSPARATRAVIAWSFDHPEAVCEQHQRSAAVFLAAFHHDAAMLDPIRNVFAHIRRRVREDALPEGVVLAVMAACDGIFVAEMLSLYAQPPQDKQAIRGALLSMLPSAGA